MMGSRGATKNNDSCAFSTLFKFLPEFMTRLIQWGLKPSKNSNYLENHVFRGHREKSPPRARRRAVMALNLASGNFDARPTAGLARRHEKH